MIKRLYTIRHFLGFRDEETWGAVVLGLLYGLLVTFAIGSVTVFPLLGLIFN